MTQDKSDPRAPEPKRDQASEGSSDPVTAKEFVEALSDYCSFAPVSVEQVPTIRLEEWQVFRVDNADRLVGWSEMFGEGRMSGTTVLVSLDARSAQTGSGRIYLLDGPAKHTRHADRACELWGLVFAQDDIVNVTAGYADRQRRVDAAYVRAAEPPLQVLKPTLNTSIESP